MKPLTKKLTVLSDSILVPRFGEGEGEDEGEGEGEIVTMTQQEFDAVIQKRLERDRKARNPDGKLKETLAQLNNLQTTLKMTDEEKTELETRLHELEAQVLTKEEIEAKERKKAEQKYQTELQAAVERASQAEELYSTSRIDSELTRAAASSGVLKNSLPLVLSYIKGQTKLVPILDDDGKPTGGDRVMVTYTEQTEDGPTTEDLTPAQVFEKMAKNTDAYGNLFDSKARGGLGGDSGSGPRKTGYRPGMTTQEYMKLRKENPDSIYGS